MDKTRINPNGAARSRHNRSRFAVLFNVGATNNAGDTSYERTNGAESG
jgi:hypothetical protein